jgi:CHAT domain-containing protein
MGDPDYDAVEGDAIDNNRGPVVAVDPSRDYRSLPDCEGFWSTLVSPLPNTRREVESIAASWRATETEPALVLLGSDADEAAFKANAGGKRIIHLATHGYYIGGNCEDDKATTVNPLLLTGLFLSRANLRGQGGSGGEGEDGVLTAFEVSGLNLDGCRLVVLSACETGLGTAEEGEGVYGLRRAFHMAGARTVVSALWEISDADAARVASQLYQRSSRGVMDRLRELQIREIESLRARKMPDHPVRWAAFVAQGDWRY